VLKVLKNVHHFARFSGLVVPAREVAARDKNVKRDERRQDMVGTHAAPKVHVFLVGGLAVGLSHARQQFGVVSARFQFEIGDSRMRQRQVQHVCRLMIVAAVRVVHDVCEKAHAAHDVPFLDLFVVARQYDANRVEDGGVESFAYLGPVELGGQCLCGGPAFADDVVQMVVVV